jgi:hypothetical protein
VEPRPRARRMAIWELSLLIAGIAVGFWLFGMGLRFQIFGDQPEPKVNPYGVWIGLLGGLSIVGPPLLLWERRRSKRRFGPGGILWFSQGMSAWLLWPPFVIARASSDPRLNRDSPLSAHCFAYGTPLMALYLGSALLAGGWFRRRGRARLRYSWHERFGLILGMIWACTGGYCLYLIYGNMK